MVNAVNVRSRVALSAKINRNVFLRIAKSAPHPALRATFSPPCGEKGGVVENRLGKPIAVSVVLIGGVGNIDSGPKALKNIPSTLRGPGTPHSGNTSIPFMRIGSFDRFQLFPAICSFQALVR